MFVFLNGAASDFQLYTFCHEIEGRFIINCSNMLYSISILSKQLVVYAGHICMVGILYINPLLGA